MNDVVSIRPAVDGDAAALADLSGQLGYPSRVEIMRERLLRARAARIGEVYVAVAAGGTLVGWTHVVPRLQLEESPFAEIAGLVVADGARGVGVGAQLLRSAEQWAVANGFGRMRVRSNVVRERAHRFYLREGYRERKRQVVFDKDLADPS